MPNRLPSRPTAFLRLAFGCAALVCAIAQPAVNTAAENAEQTAVARGRDPAYWPFAARSPWNHPIGSQAKYVQIGSPAFDVRGGVSINAKRWSHPVFVARETDPVKAIFEWGVKVPRLTIHVPKAARPDPSRDGHLHIINPPHTRVFELYNADVLASGDVAAELIVENDLYGTGVFTRWHGMRAYGGSAIGGLIRSGELENGIPHALAIAVRRSALNKNGPRKKPYVWPACSADDGWQATYGTRGNLYMGSLLAIPPHVDVANIGVGTSGPAYEVARALQNYGAYVTDAADANICFYVEPATSSQVHDDLANQLAKVITHLQLVANNGPLSIGGGGEPRVPLAPALSQDR